MISLFRAAWVIGRRDFTAIIFSRAFLFFLVGPLFPVIVGVVAGSIGAEVADSRAAPILAVAMPEADARARSRRLPGGCGLRSKGGCPNSGRSPPTPTRARSSPIRAAALRECCRAASPRRG